MIEDQIASEYTWARVLAGIDQDRQNIVWLAVKGDDLRVVELLIGDQRIKEFLPEEILTNEETNCCEHNSNHGDSLSFLPVVIRKGEITFTMHPWFIPKRIMYTLRKDW